MKRFIYLPSFAALALAPIALSAQMVSTQIASAPTPTTSATLYAESEVPSPFAATSSSSVDESNSSATSELEAPAATEASSAAAAQAVNKPDSIRPFSALGVGVKVGLGGIGFDAAVPISQRFNIRGGAGFLSYNYNGTVNNQNVNANLKLNNAEVMLDWFPFHGSFRLAAGMTVYNNTGVTGSTVVAGSSKITIGNTPYISDPASNIGANLSAKFGGNVVPRFTLGWGNLVPRGHKHWSFETELGLEVTGTPNVGWTYTGLGCNNTNNTCASSPVYAPILASSVATQNASLQSDFNGFKVFPIFNIGLSYKIGGSH